MDAQTERYLVAVRERAMRPAKTWQDVMWQVELETQASLDSKEFFDLVDERCKVLGIGPEPDNS